MGFCRQEHWSELSGPPPGDLADPGIEPGSPALQADSLRLSHRGNPELPLEPVESPSSFPSPRPSSLSASLSLSLSVPPGPGAPGRGPMAASANGTRASGEQSLQPEAGCPAPRPQPTGKPHQSPGPQPTGKPHQSPGLLTSDSASGSCGVKLGV